MTVRWTAEFHCDVCNATITYEDETPEIYTDRQSLIENNKALRWIETNRNAPHTIEHPLHVSYYDEWPLTAKGWQLMIGQTKYILCNVCGGRIYFA